MKRSPMNRGSKGMKRCRIKPRKFNKQPTVDGATVKELRDEMDALVRTIIALRDKRCFTCPQREGLQVGHLFRRGIERTRWRLDNNNAQCESCNALHETSPEHYIGAFVQTKGEEAYNELRTEAHKRGKLTYVELLEIRDELRREAARHAR